MNKQYNIRGINGSSLKINDTRIVDSPSVEIKYPITIYMNLENTRNSVISYIKQAFNIINDNYIFIDSLPSGDEYEIVSIYGGSNNSTYVFPFLRELFLNKIDITKNNEKYKRIFIGRKQSFKTNNSGISDPERIILNEEEFVERLSEYNIQCIYLEDYSFEEKINIFNSVELILSTNSSALTFTLWCNNDVKVIEISNKYNHATNHYRSICNTLGLEYHRYSDINDDDNHNFVINNDDNIYKFIAGLLLQHSTVGS